MLSLLPLLLLACLPVSAAAEPDLGELVEILRDRGVIEEAEYEAIHARAQAQQERSWYERIDLWGDFRARYESFHYQPDTVNGHRALDDRHRFRYRIRLGLAADVNEHADVFVRLATGASGRTTNSTLGSALDFGTDGIFLDKAYVRVSPFADGELPGRDGSLWLVFGRTVQPWRWDGVYKDWLLWDDELSPSGAYVDGKLRLGEGLDLFANAGFFTLDENATSKDPSLAHAQTGVHARPLSGLRLGARASYFYFSSLDAPFVTRGSGFGNIPGGLTGRPAGGSIGVGELGSYAGVELAPGWPALVFAHVAKNLDARSASVTNGALTALPGTFSTDREGLAWLVGGQIGDPGHVARFRLIYAELEANAFPGQLIDSDLFDGLTNRRGFVADLSRKVSARTAVSLTGFMSDPIETSGGYLSSLAGSERLRLQANVVYGF